MSRSIRYAAGVASLDGREPFRSAAETILVESGCTIRRWRSGPTGRAAVRSADWEIEIPQPRGPVSYATLAHEVGHQELHRPDRRDRALLRWEEEVEAWEWSLATFDRFDLPGRERAEVDARRSIEYAALKATRSVRDFARRVDLAERIVVRLPDWFGEAAIVERGERVYVLARPS